MSFGLARGIVRAGRSVVLPGLVAFGVLVCAHTLGVNLLLGLRRAEYVPQASPWLVCLLALVVTYLGVVRTSRSEHAASRAALGLVVLFGVLRRRSTFPVRTGRAASEP